MARGEGGADPRKLVLSARKLSEAFGSGDFKSLFHGRGVEFETLREYGPDDDARGIDWTASARVNRPFVRTYAEDRSLALELIVDLSASMGPSAKPSPRWRAALVAGLCARAACLRGMRAGAFLFGGGTARRIRPGKDSSHALAIAETVSSWLPPDGGSALGQALDSARRSLLRRSLVIVASDFRAEGYGAALQRLARRHDLVLLLLREGASANPPRRGSFRIRDAETGEPAWLPFWSKAFREDYVEAERRRIEALKDASRASGARFLEIGQDEDPATALIAFFARKGSSRSYA